MAQVQNRFSADNAPEPFITDINNPPPKRYVHQEFPKMLYAADKKPIVVLDQKECTKKLNEGWSAKPASDVPAKTPLDSLALAVTRPTQNDMVVAALQGRHV